MEGMEGMPMSRPVPDGLPASADPPPADPPGAGRLVGGQPVGGQPERRRRPPEPPDVPGVVFGRMRHGRFGRALRAHPVLVDSAFAAAIGATMLPTIATSPLQPAIAALLVVAAVAPLGVRRRLPATAFAACAVMASLQGLLSEPITGSAALLVSFYTVAARRSRRATGVAAGVVAAGSVAISATLSNAGTTSKVAILVFLTALAVTAGVLGINVGTRRAYLAALADRAARLERDRDQQARLAAAAERARIAREMHDIVAHNLSVMIALADGATFALREPGSPASAAQAARAVDSVSATGREALAQMRGLLGVLRDERSEPATTAPQPRLGDLDDLVEQVRHAGLPVTLTVAGGRRELPADVELTVFRIVQESLTNVLKHAGPGARAEVRLRYDDEGVDIEVANTGRGAPGDASGGPPPPAPAGGRGIAGMRERAGLHGGTLSAGPGPGLGGGWRVTARIRTATAPRARTATAPRARVRAPARAPAPPVFTSAAAGPGTGTGTDVAVAGLRPAREPTQEPERG
jgi:signal transduction histidine kinase